MAAQTQMENGLAEQAGGDASSSSTAAAESLTQAKSCCAMPFTLFTHGFSL